MCKLDVFMKNALTVLLHFILLLARCYCCTADIVCAPIMKSKTYNLKIHYSNFVF